MFQKIINLAKNFILTNMNLIISGLIAIIVSYFSNLFFKKIIKNYELYINKKHSVYLDLWSSLAEAINAVNSQRGPKKRIPLEEMNLKDLKEEMAKLQLTNKQKDKWLEKFNEYQSGTRKLKKLTEKDWYDLLSKIDVISALPSVNKLKHEYIFNQPFLSEELDKLYASAISLLKEIAIVREYQSNTPEERKEDRLKVDKNFKKIEQVRKEILSNIREELASGKYNIIGNQSKKVLQKLTEKICSIIKKPKTSKIE